MLHELVKIKPSQKKRVGRGMASGKGKTSGRGHNGQKSRSGKKFYAGFEGGQTPLARKVTKLKGFKKPNRVDYQVVNLEKLSKFPADSIVSKEVLWQEGYIKRMDIPVKILSKGDIDHPLTVRAEKISPAALAKLSKAGGVYEVHTDTD